MRIATRLNCATAALALALSLGRPAAAEPSLLPLSPTDAAHYVAAFAACARGDFIESQMETTEIRDPALMGYVAYDELMHPSAHRASFDELSGWLVRFRDLPLAGRVFGLAERRKPSLAVDPPAPMVAEALPAPRSTPVSTPSERSRAAREAFYAGDLARALTLAPASGDRWIAGLAAYRLRSYQRALDAFRDLAQDASEDAWARSAAAFWGARSATALGEAAVAVEELRVAAAAPQTFYGMIAARQLRSLGVAPQATAPVQTQAPLPAQPSLLQLASFAAVGEDPAAFVMHDARAHRAAALAQVGRLPAAAAELRAGLALAGDAAAKARWTALALALGAPMSLAPPPPAATIEDYPTPMLAPKDGFTIDRALVYAIVRQESRFNPQAVSGKGAVGLMQLTPVAAVRAAGDDKLRTDMSPLFDPALNLRVGQDYLGWLMDRAVGYGLVRVVAAYNGGPGMVQRTAQLLGAEADDPLTLLEALPPLETRAYVQKVLAGYWTYKAMFGEETPSLDALAGGGRTIDARLDLAEPAGASTQLSGQLLQPDLR
jgi:soluble lytic murein transglycosylase-like protein